MKKYILASLLCALSAAASTNSQAQSNSRARNRQNDTTIARMMAAQTSDYVGMWQGMLRTPEGSRRVVLDIARRPDGTGFVGNMVTSAQTPYSVLVDNFTAQDRQVRLDMKTANSAFAGTSNRAMTEIRGVWTHEGKALPLTLKRMELTARNGSGNAYETQSQVAAMPSNGHDDEYVGTPYETRRTPAFRIGPPRWFPWYEWTPRPGNQEVPYGTYYW